MTTVADKLIVARQEYLWAKYQVVKLTATFDHAEPLTPAIRKAIGALQRAEKEQAKTLLRWVEALEAFDRTYGAQ